MPSDQEIVFRLILASVLGGIIGLEREVHGREAGVRTYLLVSLGSALMMIISQYLVFQYPGKVPGDIVRADPGRIAAQAITGIGFLGAGVIMRYRDRIRGLTTAAGMWVGCALGLAIGSGYYLYGSVVAGITLISLVGLKEFEKRLSRDWYRDLTVVSDDTAGQFERIQEIIEKNNVQVTHFALKKEQRRKELTVDFRLRFRGTKLHRKILDEVLGLEGIKVVELR
jgi:putative Mg2+ transporter-C (MgtC) family protein